AAPPAKQKRVTVLFRFILLIPHLFVAGLVLEAAIFGAFFGWFVAIFTGRNPIQKFTVGALRWYSRVLSYGVFLTGVYPPFSLDEEPNYPIQVHLVPGRLGRVSVLFRIILMIPALVLNLLSVGGLEVLSVVAWLITLIRGTLPLSMHNAFAATIRFNTRVQAYLLLAQNPYPRGLFGDSTKSSPNETSSSLDESRPDDLAVGAEDSDYVTIEDATIGDAPKGDSSVNIPVIAAVFEEQSNAGALHVTAPSEISETSGDPSWGLTKDPVWPFCLSKGGRLVLILMLLIGIVGWPLYFAYVAPGIGNNDGGFVWSIQYRSDISPVSEAVIKALPDFSASPPDWHALTVDCANIEATLSSLSQVAQYPVPGPDKNLLTGINEVAVATQTCIQTVVPKLDALQLPSLTKSFESGSYQLKLFLNETPGVF
ncbi:MAG TPA: DUF4389 domain-containing protein, partial [Acidimicrobiales bacterium]